MSLTGYPKDIRVYPEEAPPARRSFFEYLVCFWFPWECDDCLDCGDCGDEYS